MLSITIPIWLLAVIVVLIIGVVFYVRVASQYDGGYDFFTPMALLGIIFVTLAIIAGILLGKFVF